MQDINREHPEYKAWKNVWPKYRDLYAGGEQFTANADRYLIPRQKEPAAVYRERVSRAFYENYAGSIIDWYAATLFRREPILTFDGRDEPARRYYNELAEDCDRRGSTLSDFFRRQVIEAMVTGRSYIAIDFPKGPRPAGSRAEEDALGLSRGYFSEYPAESVIHWQKDERGEYEWVVLRTERELEEENGDKQTLREWVRYDRSRYEIWRQEETEGRAPAPQKAEEGLHGLAGLGKVPVFEFTLGEGMWLMNRAASLQLEHFNKSNALAWALTMGLFAMPVIYSDSEFKQVVGDAEFEAILTRAAEEGAKRALADVGLDGDEAALDIRDLRSLVDCIRLVRRTAMQTAVRMITTGVMLALLAGIAIKLKIFGGGP